MPNLRGTIVWKHYWRKFGLRAKIESLPALARSGHYDTRNGQYLRTFDTGRPEYREGSYESDPPVSTVYKPSRCHGHGDPYGVPGQGTLAISTTRRAASRFWPRCPLRPQRDGCRNKIAERLTRRDGPGAKVWVGFCGNIFRRRRSPWPPNGLRASRTTHSAEKVRRVCPKTSDGIYVPRAVFRPTPRIPRPETRGFNFSSPVF